MMTPPENCPLTPEQFARLPLKVQTSKTMIWVKDAENPDPATLDRIVGVCNRGVLKQLAPLYFEASRLTQQTNPTRGTAPMQERQAHGA